VERGGVVKQNIIHRSHKHVSIWHRNVVLLLLLLLLLLLEHNYVDITFPVANNMVTPPTFHHQPSVNRVVNGMMILISSRSPSQEQVSKKLSTSSTLCDSLECFLLSNRPILDKKTSTGLLRCSC
jgi:hypothetical protein